MFAVTISLAAAVSLAAVAAGRADTRPPAESAQECWETRCQRDHWPANGCEQYGMAETKRVPCGGGGGHVYTCCRPSDGGERSPQPLHRHPCGHNGSVAECRPTGSRPFGCDCEPYEDVADGQRSQCAEGYEFVCCGGSEEDDDRTGDDDHNDDDDHKGDEDEDENAGGQGVKRGRMSVFYPAVGACGKKNSARELVGAVGPNYFRTKNPNDDPVCGGKVKIVDPHTSKSVVIRVVDKCGGCSKNDILVTPAAFKKIKCTGDGMIRVKWNFV